MNDKKNTVNTRLIYCLLGALLLLSGCSAADNDKPKQKGAVSSNEHTPKLTGQVRQISLALLDAQIPAFPGAQGDGASSKGGRGGKVLIVDRLDDPCPTKACTTEDLADPAKTTTGTLRWALLQTYPRTVVFQVFGMIDLQEDHVESIDGQLHIKRLAAIRITHPYLTVAGQTAPAGGITIRNNGLSILTHDVVLRYVRFRTGRGSRPFFRGQQNPQTLMLENGAERVIVDHCSFSWMPAEGVSIFTGELWDGSKGSARDITLSWNIMGEGLIMHEDGRGHPNAAMMSGFQGNDQYAPRNVTLHHNLLVHAQKRNADMLGHNARLVNNLIYNWQWLPTVLGGGVKADVIGNTWQPGPMNNSPTADKSIHLVPSALDVAGYSADNWWHAVSGEPSLYLEGNVFSAAKGKKTINKRLLCYYAKREVGCQNKQIKDSWFRTSPLPVAVYKISVDDAATAEKRVLATAGVGQRINRSGKWVNNRDVLDERYVREYRERTYDYPRFPWHEKERGGYPPQIEGAAPIDKDRDGMSDHWELARGLNPNDASDANQIPPKGEGYTYLEYYINGLEVPPVNGG